MIAVDSHLFDQVLEDRRGLVNMERLTDSVAAAGLDAVIATSRINVIYTGGACIIGEIPLLTFVVTTADGSQAYVVNEADVLYVRSASWIEDIRDFAYSATKHSSNLRAIELLGEALDDLGVSNGRVGIEKSAIAAVWLDELVRVLPRATIDDASPVFEEARLIKTPMEADLLRDAAYYTDKAMATAFALQRPGNTERDLRADILSNVLRFGAEDVNHAIALSGVHSTVVHAQSSSKPMTTGEIVHCDIGGCFGGYVTDIGRNASIGEPSPRSREINARLYGVQLQIIDRMRPGAVAGELWEFGKGLLTEAGMNHPWGTLGHSTGLGTHEGFEIGAGSERVLESGMVLNVEPTHIEEGDARYQIEDTLLVPEDGPPEVFSSFTRREEIFEIR